MATERGVRKTREGEVIADRMNKTVVVRVERRVRHPLYGKEMRVFRKLYAHDEENRAKVGDRVRVIESRPISRLKRWRVVEVLAAAPGARAEGAP